MSAAPKTRRISIHALLTESDQYWATRARAAQLFLSTLSLRRATNNKYTQEGYQPFLSTLSLRRATRARAAEGASARNFYPRSPYGERQISRELLLRYQVFLSTLSLRRATPRLIGIDAGSKNFYPRSPYGERQHLRIHHGYQKIISIHALLTESDFVRPLLPASI